MNQADSNPAKKIIFIGHEASRTGAPILLLHLLQWLKRSSGMQFEILLKRGGPLEGDFAALAPTTVLKLSRLENLICRIYNRLGWKIPARFSLSAKAVQYARRRKIGLVYANTVAVAEEVEALSRLALPIVWHIHEMPFVIQSFDGGQPFRNASRFASAYIVASEGVKRGLVANYSVPAQKIKVTCEFISPAGNEIETVKANREAVRKELALPENAFVAGMCGTIGWRKGVDLFITVAKHLATEFPEKVVYLLWIGAPENDVTQKQVEHDVQMAALANRVQFIGVKSESVRYLAALDVFTLFSREDPFPLAMLEAASLGMPTLCFSQSGGGPEFVGADAGVVVEYADTLAAAKALIQLSEQPALRQKMGAAARKKVMDCYTVEIQAPKIAGLIEELAQNPLMIAGDKF
jgi:glycosyltransferase involved in cell wall biosynthesis